MNRLDRALGILLLLRNGSPVSAAELSRQFEVSPRTIYRDIEMLSAIGVPVYAEMGRSGGFRLMEGYFLPPVMFSVGEALSLLLGLTALRRLPAQPFAAELETAQQKLLAAVPDPLREVLARVRQIVGFEAIPIDVFHPEPPETAGAFKTDSVESRVVTVFLQSIVERKTVGLHYQSPYTDPREHKMVPLGLLWDRERCYLVGRRIEGSPAGSARPESAEPRLWRADRVVQIRPGPGAPQAEQNFDVSALLGRKWLQQAMKTWAQTSPVTLHLTRPQAERLQQDWYYQHARYDDLSTEQVVMTFGETNPQFVLALLRWLGPGAELIEPAAWRAQLAAELRQMLAAHEDGGNLR
jgi:predicted DNA-binding transcriptional regulator YafY